MNIEIKHIKKYYGKKAVLQDVSLSCSAGQCIGILGENGSGKSTLFGVLTGLQRGKGSFTYNGTELLSNTGLRSKMVGFVPQSPPLINELNAIDNLRLWYSKKELKASLDHGILKLLGIDEFKKTRVCDMSGGMKKRLSIGCSVAHDPRILFLDEPSAALDMICKEKIAQYLRSFVKRGGICIIATHDIYELELCDQIYILKNGTLTPYSGERNVKELVGCLV